MILELPWSPQSIVGIITPLGLLGTIGTFVWKAGQWANQREADKKAADLAMTNYQAEVKKELDGFGSRVSSVESEQKAAEGRHDAIASQIERTLGAHESLLRIIGEARGTSVQCREDTIALGEKIDRRLESVQKNQVDNHLDLSTRLARVEHELVLKRDSK